MAITTGFEPTGQQQAVIDACAAGGDLVIEAGAGTGKTSTLRMAASAMTGRRGMYLAYTRATADSARALFPRQVDCVTAHSLAYRAIGWRYADRLHGRASRMPAWAIARQLGIGKPLSLGARLVLTPAHQARIVLSTVERFCYSADERIGGSHVPPVNGVDPASFAELTWRIIPWAERAWHDIRSPGGSLPFRHDHYLKLWQLTGPRIAASYLMFDEAQDANPVIVAIIQHQDMQKIAVGDSCQAIYGWRGAVDALSSWPASSRLHLSCSFRFGPAVAHEANKWLEVLGAQFLLSGTPRIASAIGPVGSPDAVLCRTNAEALTRARSALADGRRVALAGGGQEIRQLAMAALDLQAAGRTGHPELAAFRSWAAVQEFVRTDAAGCDLAASVRLIDKHGAAGVLATVEQLSGPRRADVIVSTVHRAKGLEWDNVQVADDFRRGAADRPVARAEAMLAYVAVTRARTGLDQTSLAWIDNDTRRALSTGGRSAGSLTKENTMNTAPSDADLDSSPGPAAMPYPGGRAQAESGSRIIDNDYTHLRAAASTPGGSRIDQPLVQQIEAAWAVITRTGLGEDPGEAAIRYQVLAHAAGALAHAVKDSLLTGQADPLATLERRALIHAHRLRATGIDLFERSGMSGPYAGRSQAQLGSRIVQTDFGRWVRTPAAVAAATNPALRDHNASLVRAWEDIARHDLSDGPKLATARYRLLSDRARNLAQDPGYGLPSAALTPLLVLALHAEKHSIRLHSTTIAIAKPGESFLSYEAMCQATWERPVPTVSVSSHAPYRGLPGKVAAAAVRGHTEIPRPSQATPPARGMRPTHTARQRPVQSERDQ